MNILHYPKSQAMTGKLSVQQGKKCFVTFSKETQMPGVT